jgi:hypothetical protein
MRASEVEINSNLRAYLREVTITSTKEYKLVVVRKLS